MANGENEHDNPIFAPVAKAFTDLRVEVHVKTQRMAKDTGIARSTISDFTSLESAMRIDTLMILLKYMNLELLHIGLRITDFTRDEVHGMVDEAFDKRIEEEKNKDLIPPKRVRDKEQ